MGERKGKGKRESGRGKGKEERESGRGKGKGKRESGRGKGKGRIYKRGWGREMEKRITKKKRQIKMSTMGKWRGKGEEGKREKAVD